MRITVDLRNAFWLRFCNARIGWASATIVNTDDPAHAITNCVAGITIGRSVSRDPHTLISITTPNDYVVSVTDVYPYSVFAAFPVDLAKDQGECVGDIALNVKLKEIEICGDPVNWFLRK